MSADFRLAMGRLGSKMGASSISSASSSTTSSDELLPMPSQSAETHNDIDGYKIENLRLKNKISELESEIESRIESLANTYHKHSLADEARILQLEKLCQQYGIPLPDPPVIEDSDIDETLPEPVTTGSSSSVPSHLQAFASRMKQSGTSNTSLAAGMVARLKVIRKEQKSTLNTSQKISPSLRPSSRSNESTGLSNTIKDRMELQAIAQRKAMQRINEQNRQKNANSKAAMTAFGQRLASHAKKNENFTPHSGIKNEPFAGKPLPSWALQFKSKFIPPNNTPTSGIKIENGVATTASGGSLFAQRARELSKQREGLPASHRVSQWLSIASASKVDPANMTMAQRRALAQRNADISKHGAKAGFKAGFAALRKARDSSENLALSSTSSKPTPSKIEATPKVPESTVSRFDKWKNRRYD